MCKDEVCEGSLRADALELTAVLGVHLWDEKKLESCWSDGVQTDY